MRWHQAKTLMILLFLILNAILGYYNFIRPSIIKTNQSWNPAVYEEALAKLAAEGIYLSNKPSEQTVELPVLRIQRLATADSAQQLASTLLIGEADLKTELKQTLSGDMIWQFQKDSRNLEVSSDGRYTYFDADQELENNKVIDESADIFQIAKNFCDQHDLDLKSLLSFPVQKLGSEATLTSHLVSWYAQYKGFPIFDAELGVIVREGKVIILNNTLCTVVEEAEQPLWLCNATDILLRLVSDSRMQELSSRSESLGRPPQIHNLQLGYYGFNQVLSSDANEMDLLVYPTWRVLLEGGEVLYFDALSSQRIYP